MTLKDRLFNAKHWHIFIVVFVLPILSLFIFFELLLTEVLDPQKVFNEDIVFLIGYWALTWLVSQGVQYAWMWHVATGLQEKMPEGVTLPIQRIKIFFLFPILYMLIVALIFTSFVDPGTPKPPALILSSILFIFPLHLFTMFCMFHSMFFVAKSLRTAELQRQTTFSDFAGEFFMVWFFPIGIWILQPRINKIQRHVDSEPTLAQ